MTETDSTTLIPPVKLPTSKIAPTDSLDAATRSSRKVKRPPHWTQDFHLSKNTRDQQEVLKINNRKTVGI